MIKLLLVFIFIANCNANFLGNKRIPESEEFCYPLIASGITDKAKKRDEILTNYLLCVAYHDTKENLDRKKKKDKNLF